jgi:hypothetical protein
MRAGGEDFELIASPSALGKNDPPLLSKTAPRFVI